MSIPGVETGGTHFGADNHFYNRQIRVWPPSELWKMMSLEWSMITALETSVADYRNDPGLDYSKTITFFDIMSSVIMSANILGGSKMAVKRAHVLWVAAFILCGFQNTIVKGGTTALTTVRVASGIDRPLSVTASPGDSTRLFILGEGGIISILNLETGTLNAAPFLDITDRVDSTEARDQGTGGMAFDPDYENNGFFYVTYFRDIGGDFSCVVARYSRLTVDTADPDSEQILMVIDEPAVFHDVTWLAFGPNDDYLYIGVGDGGLVSGARESAQDITMLRGKILRIDPHGTDGPGGNYGIPPTNPFVGVAGADEIWFYGLRSPWRGAFDPATGDFWQGDVGQGSWEELNFIEGGGVGGENLGWDCREGAHNFDFDKDCPSQTFVEPIHEYFHNSGRCAIIGGAVYRGCAIPELQGAYFFSDFCTDEIWSLRYDPQSQMITEFIERHGELQPADGLNLELITSYGTDALGEMYLCCRGQDGNVTDTPGEVYKIVPLEVSTEQNFDADPGTFTYQDDTFRSTSNPNLADGTYEAAGGQAGGGLRVILGGDSTEMSGGWARNIEIVGAPATVQIKLSFRLLFTGGYESDEFGQALMSVDGTLIGQPPNDYLFQFVGNGNTNFDSGWVTRAFSLTLAPGMHEIIVGGYNNKSTVPQEVTEILFDDFRVAVFSGDTDADTIHDNCDNCPANANTSQADADGDTTGDACDGCPNDANKIAPQNCGCGVAEVADGDMNIDGITDSEDIQRFVDALTSGSPTLDDACHGNFNGVNDLDIDDVPGFVNALLSAP
ncbi:MAG: PQQ-dependent sugar dehydrogenase [Phycisphaerales bacterium]|nr:PQQ-dependent sugar dehydrogenase [Phycisphaerales bacterium]